MRYHKCTGSDGQVVEFGRVIRVNSSAAMIDVFRSSEKYRSVFASVFPDFTISGGTAVAKPSKSAVAELREIELGVITECPGLMAGADFRNLESVAKDFSWSSLLTNLPGILITATDSTMTVRTAGGDVKFIGDGDHSGVFPLSQVGSVVYRGERIDVSKGFNSLLRDRVWYPPYSSLRDDVKSDGKPKPRHKPVGLVIDTLEPVKRGEIV